VNTETKQNGAPQTAAPAEPPKPAKRASVGKRRRDVAPTKANAAQKPTRARKPAKGRGSARAGSKTAKILDLLKRPGGATLGQLMKATRWQAHSARGFLSGTIGKKMRIAVKSTMRDDGSRAYSIKG
jgi:hypothetical protein